MHQVACSKLRELRDGVNYASKYGISNHEMKPMQAILMWIE